MASMLAPRRAAETSRSRGSRNVPPEHSRFVFLIQLASPKGHVGELADLGKVVFEDDVGELVSNVTVLPATDSPASARG
jgi:hypothetical protein